MAPIYAEKVIGIEHPRAALLNIGEEDKKGSQFRARSARPAEGGGCRTSQATRRARYPLPLRNFDAIITERLHGQRMPEDHRGHVEDPVQDAQRASRMSTPLTKLGAKGEA